LAFATFPVWRLWFFALSNAPQTKVEETPNVSLKPKKVPNNSIGQAKGIELPKVKNRPKQKKKMQ